MDPLQEVKQMKQEINIQVQNWIHEEELPPKATLKPIKKFDGLYPTDEEERQAYWDFINWAINEEHAVLLYIPKQQNENDFWQLDLDDSGTDVSAFNTADFERMHHQNFNKYAYKIKKILERVQNLALLYSCITQDEGKANIHQRFINLIANEFRDKALILLETYKKYPHFINKEKAFERIVELNINIRKCKDIWQKYAYQD
jgi:hypothetical protein